MAALRVVGLGAGDDDEIVGAVREGHPHLLAAEHPLVTVERRPAAHRRDVGARARLGHRERAQVLAPHRLAELLLGIGQREVGRGDEARPRDDAGRAHPRARQLLGDEAVLEHAEPEAADRLGREDPEEAELAHLLADVRRDLALHGIERIGDGQDPLHRELTRHLLDRVSFLGVVGGGNGREELLYLAHAGLLFVTGFMRSSLPTRSARGQWPRGGRAIRASRAGRTHSLSGIDWSANQYLMGAPSIHLRPGPGAGEVTP